MARCFDSLPAFLGHGFDSVIDVRSPSEFAEDHVPGAINLPVLSDVERAEVGTLDLSGAEILGGLWADSAQIARMATAGAEVSGRTRNWEWETSAGP